MTTSGRTARNTASIDSTDVMSPSCEGYWNRASPGGGLGSAARASVSLGKLSSWSTMCEPTKPQPPTTRTVPSSMVRWVGDMMV
ncbi:hypothetical protein VTN02DRAFT_869 [Thermoascus thermophilus]